MSVAAYGIGKNIEIVGGYAAYGFGILNLFPGGIITRFGVTVYKELRRQLIAMDARICVIEEDL